MIAQILEHSGGQKMLFHNKNGQNREYIYFLCVCFVKLSMSLAVHQKLTNLMKFLLPPH